MRYIDMHCDTLGSALAQKTETFLELDHTMVDGLRLQQAEAGAQFFAMFLPQRNDPDWFGLEEMPPAEALMRKMYDIFPPYHGAVQRPGLPRRTTRRN